MSEVKGELEKKLADIMKTHWQDIPDGLIQEVMKRFELTTLTPYYVKLIAVFEEMWSEFSTIEELENLQEAIRLETLERKDEDGKNIYSMKKSLKTITKEIEVRKKWSGKT